jgi:hypothetical protein
MAIVVALTAGRDTWNKWVSGSPTSETVTLWLVLIAGPVLLATCCALLLIGAVLRTRQWRRSGQASSPWGWLADETRCSTVSFWPAPRRNRVTARQVLDHSGLNTGHFGLVNARL